MLGNATEKNVLIRQKEFSDSGIAFTRFFAARREIDMEFREVRKEIIDLRIELARMDTRMGMLEKSVDYLTQKMDHHTWGLALGVAAVSFPSGRGSFLSDSVS
ncbi:MAG: hypothetical protein LBO82_06590 [Synergistaceae bacterium]|nr:hypothetical protein [Synergistaceae bacterium]